MIRNFLSILLILAISANAPLAMAQSRPSSRTTAWSVSQQPAAATQATISKAAVASTRHVTDSVTVCISAVAAQPDIIFNLRDGGTGAGTIVWTVRLAATAGTSQCVTTNITFVGTSNTAMTLESAAAPAATNFATVSLSGYDIQ